MAASRRKRFQLTSLPSEEKQRLSGYIKKLGGIYIDLQIFSKQATHVICGKANRGEKYLGGCALGKWVLQKEFIEDSYRKGSWVNEENYEWTTNVLEAGSSRQLIALYDAPRKWRLAIQHTKMGAFKSWNAIVHVQDNKMKKAYERLLEAGDATVFKKKISFQDLSTMPKDLTHVFAETSLRKDVLHLENHGISVQSPDYIPEFIIKGPNGTVVSCNGIMKYKNLTNACKIPRIADIKKSAKVGTLPGKENGVITSAKSKEHAGKRGVKRLSSDCDLCTAKRQKTMHNLPPCINMNAPQNAQKAKHLIFPSYLSNILESCMDEECFNLGMESLMSSLSSHQAPTSKWLHIIINRFLLNAESEQLAFQSYHLLRNILEVQHPTSCQSLYLEALAEPVNDDSQNVETTTTLAFVNKVIRISLRKQENDEIDRMQRNAMLLMKFLDCLFKLDGCNGGQSSSIVTHILWPMGSNSLCQSNTEIKEFVALCSEAVKLALSNDKSICHLVLDWLSMAVTLKKHEDITGQVCESLAQQLFMEISKDNSYEAIKLLLQALQSSWLKMRMLELLLENFDKQLIPQEYKQLLNKSLKLNKIVMCYFFLLPNTKEIENGIVEDKEKITKNKRKNGKGETPLHLACIRNDAMKVEDILKEDGIDVNMTDNAGWTALHEACNHGHVPCVWKILQYHEKTNKVNMLACPDDGITVLHDAVMNNHLNVVKLLTQTGGLDLLEAKTASGMTAIQLSKTNKMSVFLESELNRLQSTQKQQNIPRPSPEAYDKVLSINKQKYFIPMLECEKHLFYVLTLLQIYVKEHIQTSVKTSNGKTFCTTCIADAECLENISQHLTNLKQHIKLISGKQNLSHLCQLYLTSMNLCLSYTSQEEMLSGK